MCVVFRDSIFFKAFDVKRKSPQGDLKQETYRKVVLRKTRKHIAKLERLEELDEAFQPYHPPFRMTSLLCAATAIGTARAAYVSATLIIVLLLLLLLLLLRLLRCIHVSLSLLLQSLGVVYLRLRFLSVCVCDCNVLVVWLVVCHLCCCWFALLLYCFICLVPAGARSAPSPRCPSCII